MIVATDAASTRRLGTSMADKAPKAKANASAKEKGVLGTLPAARPPRLGAPRREAVQHAPARRRTTSAKPRAVRSAAPELNPRHVPVPPPRPLGAPKGTELVTTAIRATGELAQIGFVVGGQVVKRTIRRLPHP